MVCWVTLPRSAPRAERVPWGQDDVGAHLLDAGRPLGPVGPRGLPPALRPLPHADGHPVTARRCSCRNAIITLECARLPRPTYSYSCSPLFVVVCGCEHWLWRRGTDVVLQLWLTPTGWERVIAAGLGVPTGTVAGTPTSLTGLTPWSSPEQPPPPIKTLPPPPTVDLGLLFGSVSENPKLAKPSQGGILSGVSTCFSFLKTLAQKISSNRAVQKYVNFQRESKSTSPIAHRIALGQSQK